MRQTSLINLIVMFSLTLMVSLGLVSKGWADTTDSAVYQPQDTIFQEIYLNDEGVVAIDSSGRSWHYDFEQQIFIIGRFSSTELDRGEEGTETAFEIPVEDRCTEELFVDQSTRSVLVGIDEFVDGSIITVGRVTVKGWVKGNVTSFKRVIISSSGQVDGNVKAPEIIVKDGGMVLGEEFITDSPIEFKDIVDTFSFNGLIVVLVFMVVFIAGGLILTALRNKKHLININQCLDNHKVKNPILGFIFIIFSPVVMALVIVTIVGIVLIPFIPFLYLLAAMAGVSRFSLKFGHLLLFRIMPGNNNHYIKFITGALTFWGLWILTAILLGSSGDVSVGFGILFLVISIIVSAIPAFSGIGAIVLTRFGFKEYTSWKDSKQQSSQAPSPAPPPIPQPPNRPHNNQ